MILTGGFRRNWRWSHFYNFVRLIGSSVNDVSILSRSLLIILPLSPEPLIVERSIFLSAAIFFANGDAKTRLSETVTSSLMISVSPTFSGEVSAIDFSLSLITAGSLLKLA